MVWKIQNCATPKEKPKIFGSVDEAIKAGLLSMLAYKSEKQVEKLWDEMRGLKLDLASHGGGFEGSVGSVNRAWDCILEPRKRTVKERRLDALLILRVFEHFAELAAREGSSWSCKEHANAGRKVLQAYLFSFSGEDGSRLIYQIFSSIKLREPGWSQRFYQRVNRRTLMHYYDVLCAAFQSLDTSVAISEVAISEVWTRMPGIRGLVAHLMAAALEAAQDEKNTTGTVKIIVAGHGFLGSAQAVSASVAALKYLPAPVKIVCYGFGGDASVESLVLKQCKALDRNQREYEAYFFSGKYDPVNSRPPLLVYKRDGYKLVKEGTKAKSAVPDPFTYVEVSGPAPVSAESTLPPPRSDGGNSESGSTDEVANSIDVGLGDVPPQPATDNLPSPPSAPTVLREHDLSDLESANLASSSPRSELEIRSQSLANALVSGQAPEKEPTARIAEDSTLADASRDAIEKAADLIGETNRVIINKSKADTRGKAISEERQADASPRLVDSAKGLYLVDGKSWHVGNRYKLKGRIESGPIDICRATDSKTGDVVALRRIPNILGSSELAKQVLREVFMIRRLSHPYIISALDVFTRTSREVDNGIDLYVATEYGEGRVDLRDLSASELYQIMRKVLKAVQYLHSQKICHMNINPRELLFFQGTKLKVKLQGLAWAQSALEAYAGGGSSSGMLGPLPSVSVPWPPIQLQSEGDPTRSQHTMSPEPIMTAMTATLEATRAINAALAVINTQHQVLMGALTQQLQLPAVLGSVSIQQEVAAIKDQPFVLASGRSRAKLMQLLQESPRSISYQAPEVLIPSGMPHTSAVDVWSLGCSFWELLMLQTQDFAYTGGALFNMVDEQTSFEGSYEPAPSPSGLHTNLDAQSRQQLNVIFDVIGTPSSEYLEAVPNEEWRIYLKGLTHRPRKLDPHMAKLDPQAAALLSSMLVFDPSRRCTIKEALAHSLFRGLEDPSELAPSPLSSVEPSFWSVEDPSLALGLLERELDQVTGGITGKLKLLVEQVVYGQPGLPSAKTASGVLQDGTSLPTFPEASAKAASSSSPSAATSSTLQEYGSKVLGETVRPPEDEETMEAGENGDGQGGGDHMVGDKAGWTPEASLRVPSLMLEAGSKWEGQSNEKPVSNLHFEDANEEAASDVKADGTTKVSAEAGPELAWKYWEATLERIPLALQRAIEEGKELEETKEVSVAVTAEVDSFAHWTSLTRPEQEAPLVSEPTLVMRLSESKVVVAGRVNAKDLQELEKQVSSLEFPREVEAAHPDGQGAEPEVEPRPPPVLEKLVESLQPSPRDVQSLALSPTSSNLSSPLLYGEGTDLKVWNCLQTQATNGQTAIVGIIDQAWDPTVVYHIGGAKLVRIIHNLKGVDWETMEFPALREEVALCPHDGSPRSYFTLLLAKDAMEIQAVAPAGDVHGMDMVKIVAANAPDAEILYWDLDLGTKLGNETGVPMAANIIFKYATNMKRPCIISCSLQQRLGSHDHHDWLARRLDSLLGGSALPRAIAIAAGNYHSQAGYHARFKGEDVRFTLLLAKPRKGHQEESHIDPGNSRGQTPKEAEEYCTVELWVDCREPLEVTGTFKLGRYEWTDTLNTRDRPKRTAHFPRAFSGRAGLSIRWTIESPSSKERPHCVRIRLERSGVLEKDHLTVTFASQAWTDETAVHAWTNRQIHVIPLNSKGGKDLERSNQLTLSSFAGGSKSVVVASCDDAEELLSESSSGPTRTGHHQPLLAARGLFPSNRVGASQSGTSHATAAMAALIALRMQRLEEKDLESFDARSELKEAFRQAGGEANDQDQEHNGRSGYGIVGKSVANAFVRGIGGPKC